MNITFGTNISRCMKTFTKLPIIPMHSDEVSRFFIFDKRNTLIGAFNFDNEGFISNLSLAKEIQRKQTGKDAILSVVDFVHKRAKEMKLKAIQCALDTNSRKERILRRLCEKFGLKVVEESTHNRVRRLARDFNPQKELETISKAAEKATVSATA